MDEAEKEKIKYWYELLSNHKKSGMTVEEYCQRHNVKPSVWSNWRNRLFYKSWGDVEDHNYMASVAQYCLTHKIPREEAAIFYKTTTVKIAMAVGYLNYQAKLKEIYGDDYVQNYTLVDIPEFKEDEIDNNDKKGILHKSKMQFSKLGSLANENHNVSQLPPADYCPSATPRSHSESTSTVTISNSLGISMNIPSNIDHNRLIQIFNFIKEI